jgi:cytidylate kinase
LAIAIDGPAGAGKSSVAEAAASVADSVKIEFDGDRVRLDGREADALIRTPEAASRVSVHPGVRAALVAEQRRLIEGGRYVAEGRDIGRAQVNRGAELLAPNLKRLSA